MNRCSGEHALRYRHFTSLIPALGAGYEVIDVQILRYGVHLTRMTTARRHGSLICGFLADRYRKLEYVVGIDFEYEPHGAANWGTGNLATDWNLAGERVADAVLDTNRTSLHIWICPVLLQIGLSQCFNFAVECKLRFESELLLNAIRTKPCISEQFAERIACERTVNSKTTLG